ncbi:Innexin-3 [Toxocara canis]|uniref:Innexin n=1 Tax=Toxocara canis TaxID=6265 RepID=A0A0B2VFQ4_TOXCA|nr:Innexin-3 [Toxocara canis]
MFLGIPQLNKFFSSLAVTKLDDFTDRCNYYYTVMALIFFSLLVGSKQMFGEPIRCLIDQQYAGSWVGYVHDYCFISERYSLTMPSYEDETLAKFDNTERRTYENYYQWVPFLLAAQAVFFFIPHFLWRTLQKMSSLDLEMVVEEGTHLRSLVGDDRRSSIAKLTSYIEQYLNYSPTGTCGIDLGCVGRFGSFSSALYVLLKLANTVNVIIQLHVINTFVGDGTLLWGVELTSNLMAGRDWTYTGHFPRVVFCDYDKVELGNVQHKTVQCALAINILNEKFYLDGVEERMGDLDSEVKYLKEKIVDVPWNKERFLDVVQVFVLLTLWFMVLFVITGLNALFTFCTLFIPAFRECEVLSFLEPALYVDDKSSCDSGYSRQDTTQRHAFDDIRGSEGCDSGINTDVSFNTARRRRNSSNTSANRIQEGEQMNANPFFPSATVEERALLKEFTRRALCVDGVQLLRFLNTHAGAMTARDVAIKLFEDFAFAKTTKARILGNGFSYGGINGFSTPKGGTGREVEPLLNGRNNPVMMGGLPHVALPGENAPINTVFNGGFPGTDMKDAGAMPMKQMPPR